MKVIIVKPLETPTVADIASSLSAMQEVVGGYIQAVYPFEEPVALICNDEGKLMGLPPNRALRTESGEIYDIIAGTFFLCGAPPDSDHFADLTPEQIETFLRYFQLPELFCDPSTYL